MLKAEQFPELGEQLVDVCREASEAILEVYRQDFDVMTKDDNSPVTQADLAANKIIEQRLRELTPNTPILAEESSLPEYSERKNWPQYWIVDPLDGTKEFVHKRDEFTVNIALIENGSAILGVVHIPVTNVSYLGIKNLGAQKIEKHQRKSICSRPLLKEVNHCEVVASVHHLSGETERFIQNIKEKIAPVERRSMGSSLKFCLLAEGLADVYPRMAPTSEWDTAAAQAVLEAAGGTVYIQNSEVLLYNQKDSILNPNFIAVADVEFDWVSFIRESN